MEEITVVAATLLTFKSAQGKPEIIKVYRENMSAKIFMNYKDNSKAKILEAVHKVFFDHPSMQNIFYCRILSSVESRLIFY